MCCKRKSQTSELQRSWKRLSSQFNSFVSQNLYPSSIKTRTFLPPTGFCRVFLLCILQLSNPPSQNLPISSPVRLLFFWSTSYLFCIQFGCLDSTSYPILAWLSNNQMSFCHQTLKTDRGFNSPMLCESHQNKKAGRQKLKRRFLSADFLKHFLLRFFFLQ